MKNNKNNKKSPGMAQSHQGKSEKDFHKSSNRFDHCYVLISSLKKTP